MRQNDTQREAPGARVRGQLSSGLLVCLCALAGLLFFVISTQAQQNKKMARATSNSAAADVARGKYLVENVAMCEQCHTPRDSSGALDEGHRLEGAPVFLKPASPEQDWPLKAPRIGGTPPASDADMVKLLTTGTWTNGKPLRFPMMPFRMNEADAKAVVAYLRSVQPQPK
jgi:mono/diheme cytochrome c family protein